MPGTTLYFATGGFSGGVVPGSTTFTSPTYFADGTVAAPGIAFAAHQNTGFYWNTVSGSMSVASNGVIAGTWAAVPINDASLAYQANATSATPSYFSMNRNGANYGALFGFDFNIISAGVGGAVVRTVNAADSVVVVTNNNVISAQYLPAGRVRQMHPDINSKVINYTVVAADSFTTFDNTGAAGAVTFTLPAAALGLTYTFFVNAAQIVNVAPQGADTIRVTGVKPAGTALASGPNIGNFVSITCTAANTWAVVANNGFA